MMLKKYFLFLCLLTCSQFSRAAITETTLANGLRVIVKTDHRAPIVTSQLWYRVGSGDEKLGATGLSHMLEHMMFKSTTHHKTGEFSQIISEVGGTENAATTRDYTMYHQTLDREQLSLCLALESDRMQNLLIKADELKNENEVVKEERRLRTDDNPQALFLEKFSQIIFKNTSYAHGPIGWMKDIQKLTVSDLQQWYKNYYAPNNAVLVVVGDVEPEHVFQEAKKYFGNMPKKTVLPRPSLSSQFAGPQRFSDRLSAKWPWLVIGYPVPSLVTAPTPEEAYALAVLASILEGGNSSRFAKHLIRGSSLAAQASADYDLLSRLGSVFFVSATPVKAENMAELETAVLAEIEKLKTELISPAELKRAKTRLIADYIYAQDDIEDQAETIGEMAILNIALQHAEQYSEKIKAVTSDQLQKVAIKYLIPQHQLTGILIPLKKSSTKPDDSPVAAFSKTTN